MLHREKARSLSRVLIFKEKKNGKEVIICSLKGLAALQKDYPQISERY